MLIARQGYAVPYRTLHRFATELRGFGHKDLTVRVADSDSEIECQVDFGYLRMLTHPDDGRVIAYEPKILSSLRPNMPVPN